MCKLAWQADQRHWAKRFTPVMLFLELALRIMSDTLRLVRPTFYAVGRDERSDFRQRF